MTQDINLNNADCLRDVRDVGMTHIHNICTGSVTDVPWGTNDWVLAVVLSGMGLFILAVLAGLAISTVSLLRD